MNTEDYFLIKDTNINPESIKIPKLNEKEIDLIQEYIEFARHIQEIDQLFHIYKVNLDNLFINYEFINNDSFYKKNSKFKEKDDRIVINTLVINYISSAKTLIESINNFIRKKLGDEKYNMYKINCLSKIYDERFSYRLLIHLRDFAQHGHLPIHISLDNKCSFDLDHILNTPHFKHNEKLESEMKSISSRIIKDFGDNPRIMFTRSIAEFEISVLEIYNYFIIEAILELQKLRKKFDDLINRRPDIIYKSEDALDGFILYTIIDGNVHCVDPRQNPIEMVENIRDDIKIELESLKKEFKEVFKMKIMKETKK